MHLQQYRRILCGVHHDKRDKQVPPVDTVVAAIKEWQERWPTGVAFQGPEEPPADELEQMRWNLGKGFDVIAQQLGGGYPKYVP